jgi:signal transduction histidine kinase
MLGYTEMLRDETEEEARWGLLDRMEASGRDLLELIESTLDLGRIEAGRDAVSFEPTSLRTLLLAVGGSCARFPRRTGVVLRWPQDPPDCRLHTDPRKLTVVLRNLVGNALKFTDPGGEVRVTARPEPDGGVRIEVADTGVGIQPSELPLIFDRFYRGSEMIEARSEGSGLGLAIVKSIVDMHHGTIAVESRVGTGSRFVVTLPRDPREVTEVEPPQPDSPDAEPAEEPPAKSLATARPPNVDVSSPTADPPVNPEASRLEPASGQPEPQTVPQPQTTNPPERSTQVR